MSNIYGRQVILPLTNKSGGGVVAGDVVITDTTNNDAFTTTTSAGSTTVIGVAQETIANNATGRVLMSGYAALVNVNASVTRGHYGKTHTVAKQATDAGASRVAGAFCQFLTGGTTPDALVFGITDASTGSAGSPGTPALTLSTTNSTGAAVTLIATDATIAAFDATTPAAVGTAATGSAGKAARRDHVHALTTSNADATADVTLSADTPADATGATITIGAGTWMIWAYAAISCASSSAYAVCYLTDGSNAVVGEGRGLVTATSPITLPAMAVVTPGGSTTYKVRGQAGSGAGTIKILRYAEGTNIGTRIMAIQVA